MYIRVWGTPSQILRYPSCRFACSYVNPACPCCRWEFSWPGLLRSTPPEVRACPRVAQGLLPLSSRSGAHCCWFSLSGVEQEAKSGQESNMSPADSSLLKERFPGVGLSLRLRVNNNHPLYLKKTCKSSHFCVLHSGGRGPQHPRW